MHALVGVREPWQEVVIAEDGSRQIVDSDNFESTTNDSFSFGRSSPMMARAANSGETHRASASSTAARSSYANAGPASFSDERSAAADTMEVRMARLERSVTHQLEEMAQLMRKIALAVRHPQQSEETRNKAGGPARAGQQIDHDKYAA